MSIFGRPPRLNRLDIARDYLIRCLPASTVAKIYQCSRRSVYYAVRHVLKSDDPDAVQIQRLIGKAKP
jgi:hypothetical protein